MMKTFYSIIKISTNILADDSISIGLLMCGDDFCRVEFSDEKKSLSKRLLENGHDSVDFISKNITQYVSDIIKKKNDTSSTLFLTNAIISSEKMNSLSAYCNGRLRFTEPKFLNDSASDAVFDKLFKLLIDKHYQEAKNKPIIDKERSFRQKIERKLINKVKDKVHTNLEISEQNFKGIFFHFQMDCLGVNGSLIGAKALSFNRKYEAIDKELGHYFTIISNLKASCPTEKANEDKFFAIAEEPSVIESKEHKTWESLRQNPVIQLINPEESNIIVELIEERKAKKLSLFSNE